MLTANCIVIKLFSSSYLFSPVSKNYAKLWIKNFANVNLSKLEIHPPYPHPHNLQRGIVKTSGYGARRAMIVGIWGLQNRESSAVRKRGIFTFTFFPRKQKFTHFLRTYNTPHVLSSFQDPVEASSVCIEADYTHLTWRNSWRCVATRLTLHSSVDKYLWISRTP